MSTLLRKAKSTIAARAHADDAGGAAAAHSAGTGAAADADANHAQNNFVNNSHATDNGPPPPVPAKDTTFPPSFFHRLSAIRDNRKSHIDLSTAVESKSSIQAREKQLEKQSSITQLRRRLVRKASTFNLHSRRLAGVSPASCNSSYRRSAHLFPDTDTDNDFLPHYTYDRAQNAAERAISDTASTVYSRAAETPTSRREFSNATDHHSTSSNITAISPVQLPSEEKSQEITRVLATLTTQEPVSPHISAKAHITPEGHTWSKMATTPPLPYENLKKITVDACEAALSDVKAYDHPKTESWNTRIINTILAQLVGETSKPAEGSDEEPEAPRYKFVVNSTIVQHRNAYSDSPNSRRGMHSAAGAYWNNEKDGMWSFKYDAGDSKGLDVVVGIVWVWVG